VKLERKVGDYAIAGTAAYLALDEAGRVAQAGIGLTNAGSTPVRAAEAEAVLMGELPDARTIRAAAERATAAADPVNDLRGPADYKRAVTRTLTARALQRAVDRANRGEGTA
jgi:carbon-monoxide dehydrogenase medium subunit